MKYDNSNFSGKENVTRRNILEDVISLKVNKYFLYEARHIILILKPWSSHVPNAIKNLVFIENQKSSYENRACRFVRKRMFVLWEEN